MSMRPVRILLGLPLLLPACGGGTCIDIGIPNGVSISADDYEAAPPAAVVEVCAADPCARAPLDGGAFLDLPLAADAEVPVTVTVRDTTGREVARSELTARPVAQEDEAACDRGDAAQVMLELDAAGKARQVW